MELEQERTLPLPRDTVWEALNDPAVLQACIPGCESFERVDDNSYDAVVRTRIGPVSARFRGRVTLTDLQPPESYSMSFDGQGGQAGFVKGSAAVTLARTNEGCTVSYTAKATLGGKLAQLGSRLVDGAARKTANEFFDNFVAHMTPATESAAEGESDAAGVSARGPVNIWPWVAAGAGIVAVLIAIALL